MTEDNSADAAIRELTDRYLDMAGPIHMLRTVPARKRRLEDDIDEIRMLLREMLDIVDRMRV